MYGVGTAFHVDGFNRFLTAYHVIDFVESALGGRPVLFLGMNGIVFGTVSIPPDCFVPVHQVFASLMEPGDPLAALRGQPVRRPALDVASLEPDAIGSGARPPQTLPVRSSGWTPRLGERVLAVGFPQLDLSEVDGARQAALLEEGMYGAYGRIVAVHGRGVSRSNPSPVIEVESDWPGGMSGGPVFNERGEVIGLVSRSLRAEGSHPGTGYAVHFAMARDIDQFMPNNDELNPGWRLAWGVFVGAQVEPLTMHATFEEAAGALERLTTQGVIRKLSHRLGTTDFVRLDG